MKKVIYLGVIVILHFQSQEIVSQNYFDVNSIKNFQNDVLILFKTIDKIQHYQPQVIEPIRRELSTPDLWYRDYLYKLLTATTTEFDERGVERKIRKIDFSIWHKNLYELLDIFATSLISNNNLDYQALAYAIHVSYVRSLSATYLLIESMKRLAFDENLEHYVHKLAQRIMEWMHYIRHQPMLTHIWNSHFFAKNSCFECEFGTFFHFGVETLDARPCGFERYLIPFVPVYLRGELLKKLLDGIPSYNDDMRRSIEGPTRQEEPSEIATSPELQQLILRLQYLLRKKEIQENEKLRRSIEDFLKKLRPNLPPLKPMPPSQDPEESEENERKPLLVYTMH